MRVLGLLAALALLAGCGENAEGPTRDLADTQAYDETAGSQSSTMQSTQAGLSSSGQELRETAFASLAPTSTALMSIFENENGLVIFRNADFAANRVDVMFVSGAESGSETLQWSTMRPLNLSPEDLGASSPGAETRNKEIASEFVEAFNTGDAAKLESLLAADFHDHMNPVDDAGRDEIISQRTGGEAAQVSLTTQEIIAQGDMVVVRLMVASGLPPAYTQGGDLLRIRDGKIVDRWRLNY